MYTYFVLQDSHLIDMLMLVQQGFDKMGLSEQDRHNYALQLKKSLEEFTDDFLPHMKQEEEVLGHHMDSIQFL